MKGNAVICLLWAFGLSAAVSAAQERAANFDAAASRDALAKGVTKMEGRFLSKGVESDVETKRFYAKGMVVISRASGAQEQHPYVAVPLLFEVNSAVLRKDSGSAENLAGLAQVLRELSKQNAAFAIEGHASEDGQTTRNKELSDLRALTVQNILRQQGVPPEAIVRTEGFGSKHAQYGAADPRRELDRRVLVVREH